MSIHKSVKDTIEDSMPALNLRRAKEADKERLRIRLNMKHKGPAIISPKRRRKEE